MATTVVETIGTGKDYSTLAAWEAATDINLVAADEVRVGEMYGQFTETLRVQSATVDATRYRVLRGSEPYTPWADEGPKINGRIIVAEAYTRYENFGIELVTDAGQPIISINAANTRYDGVYAVDKVTAGQRVFDAKTFSATFLNCIAVGLSGSEVGGSRGFYGSNASIVCDHCVAVNMGGSGGATVFGYGFYFTNAGSSCTNSVAIGNYTSDFLVSGTKTTCVSGDGTGNVTGASLAGTFVDWSANDFRALASGPADGAGAAGTATDDFENEAHASPYEVGAYNGAVVRTLYVDTTAPATAFGSPALTLNVTATGIASGAALGTPSLVQIVAANGIASELAFGTVALGLSIVATGLASGAALGTPSVLYVVAPRGKPSSLAFGTPTLDLNAELAGIASTLAFGSHVVVWDQVVELAGIASTLAIGAHTIASVYVFEASAITLRGTVDAALSIPVVWDNNPEEGIPNESLWARCAINFASGQLIEVGNGNTYRRTGELVVTVYSPLESGEGAGLTQCDLATSAVEDQNIDGIRLHVSSMPEGKEENGWWAQTVRIPYDFDETIELTGGTSGSVADYEDIRSVLRQRADSVFTPLGVPVQYDNTQVDKGEESVWARFSVLGVNKNRISDSRYRISGIAQMLIYCPIGKGDGELLAVVDRAVRGFLPATHSGVTLRAPYATTLGRFGSQWHVSVSSPFYAEV